MNKHINKYLYMEFTEQQGAEIVRIREEIGKISEHHQDALLFQYALLSIVFDASAFMAGAKLAMSGSGIIEAKKGGK